MYNGGLDSCIIWSYKCRW